MPASRTCKSSTAPTGGRGPDHLEATAGASVGKGLAPKCEPLNGAAYPQYLADAITSGGVSNGVVQNIFKLIRYKEA
jgi:hypothetical protein